MRHRPAPTQARDARLHLVHPLRCVVEQRPLRAQQGVCRVHALHALPDRLLLPRLHRLPRRRAPPCEPPLAGAACCAEEPDGGADGAARSGAWRLVRPLRLPFLDVRHPDAHRRVAPWGRVDVAAPSPAPRDARLAPPPRAPAA
eukprot:7381273-Prymnesium_polylepis.1